MIDVKVWGRGSNNWGQHANVSTIGLNPVSLFQIQALWITFLKGKMLTIECFSQRSASSKDLSILACAYIIIFEDELKKLDNRNDSRSWLQKFWDPSSLGLTFNMQEELRQKTLNKLQVKNVKFIHY